MTTLVLCLLGSLLLCAQTVKLAPPTPIDAKKAELGGKTWNPEWDVIVEKAIPPQMLSREVPHDVRRLCPHFYTMSDTDKRAFWAYFFQALAGAEAGLNPTSHVRHTQPQVSVIDEVTHRYVRSEGLLQLTYEDSKRYDCDFNWERDRLLPAGDPARSILQPRNNLECGVTILDNQIINLRKGIVSPTSYWSTLRPGTLGYRIFLREMANPPAACEAPVRTPKLRHQTTAEVHAIGEDNRAAKQGTSTEAAEAATAVVNTASAQ